MPEQSLAASTLASTPDCPPEPAFVDLLGGRLSGQEALRLQQHADTCGRCALLLDELKAVAAGKPMAATKLDDGPARGAARAAESYVGTTLDRKYELLRLLGEGGMGTVFEARHTETGRRVAIKVINARLLTLSEGAGRRFKREGRAVAGVDSPHIVTVFDAGEDEVTGDLYLVMEHLRGQDLQALIDRVGPLPPDVVLRVAAQALAGLARAHEAGIVHRDIKPANIFLARREDGEVTVKLLDFGIAKVVESPLHTAETAQLTATGGLLGSPLYMSPEQVQSSKDVDHRTDLWSLGSTLYCALSGQAPFAHVTSVGKLIVTICGSRAPRLRTLAPWVPPEVAAVVHQAITVDPGERFPTAAAMLEAVQAIVPDVSTLREEMLVGVAPDVRGRVVPSLPPPADDAPAVAPEPPPSAPEARVVPARQAPAPPRSARRFWLAAGSAAGVALTAALLLRSPPEAHGTAPKPASPESAVSSAAPAPDPQPLPGSAEPPAPAASSTAGALDPDGGPALAQGVHKAPRPLPGGTGTGSAARPTPGPAAGGTGGTANAHGSAALNLGADGGAPVQRTGVVLQPPF